jgi:hypothetical protein
VRTPRGRDIDAAGPQGCGRRKTRAELDRLAEEKQARSDNPRRV